MEGLKVLNRVLAFLAFSKNTLHLYIRIVHFYWRTLKSAYIDAKLKIIAYLQIRQLSFDAASCPVDFFCQEAWEFHFQNETIRF